jgi:1-acyl-sn-glycerol-3-phosphate acyltransferase
MQAVRSLLFYLGMVLSLLCFGVLLPLIAILPYRRRYGVLTHWGRFILWWLDVSCGLSYEVEGREHIPAGSAAILAKHQSAWETIALQSVFPRQTWVLKRELLWIPIFGWALALLRVVAIDRKAGRKALNQLVTRGRACLEEGTWVVVFPEGTRVAPGIRGHYNIGGAMLAVKSGYAVVPVAHNAGEYWPRRGFCKRPGRIKMVVGPPIETAGRKAGEINAEVEAWIEGQMARITSGEYLSAHPAVQNESEMTR